jgi:hypothetical protein
MASSGELSDAQLHHRHWRNTTEMVRCITQRRHIIIQIPFFFVVVLLLWGLNNNALLQHLTSKPEFASDCTGNEENKKGIKRLRKKKEGNLILSKITLLHRDELLRR